MKIPFLLLALAMLCIGCQTNSVTSNLKFTFPQGIASGDPQPGAITLWTRAITEDADLGSVTLRVEISTDRNFNEIIHTGNTTAQAKWDFTVRYRAADLPSNKKLYYRFIAEKDTSMLGRTFTAPANHEAADLNFAALACSSYEQGFYGTLKRMILEDKASADEDQLQVIFHLGDFIYEVVGDDPRNDNHNPKWLIDANGKERAITPFPHGKQRPNNGHWKSGSWNPITVEDYRHLYKTYLSNPVMKEARARWPFIYTWDDHEFTDGNHQSVCPEHEILGLSGTQKVKLAANQAWYEYQPAALSHGSSFPKVENQAHDFVITEVENMSIGTSKTNGLYDEPNNLKAIHSMCIYRALHWGKDILIVVPDTKSYQEPGVSVLGEKTKTMV